MRELHSLDAVRQHLARGEDLKNAVIAHVDLRAVSFGAVDVTSTVLLGCQLDAPQLLDLVSRGALVFPRLEGFPYEAWRSTLYSPDELFAGFSPDAPCSYCETPDATIYRHFRATGGAEEPGLREAFARRLHDHGISEALEQFLEGHPKVVAFMGGHALGRDAPEYLAVARLAKQLAANGLLVATGGGPGAMEAANLGAHAAHLDDARLVEAVGQLSAAPLYSHQQWLAVAARTKQALGAATAESLGVPTFFYGHEPPNVFATHHAKYFANCTREEGLVSLATHGIVFAPGAAGTVQEIFQDACQNHYGTVRGEVAPMVLFGETFWRTQLPVAPLLEALARRGGWSDQVLITDAPEQVVRFLEERGPRRLERASWSYCGAFCAE
ncbi:MAG: LOG family protein [Archangium sp.]|nr:LOG family protein [Archangium sp.]